MSLKVENLKVSVEDEKILNGVSLEVETGEINSFMGLKTVQKAIKNS